MSRLVRLVCTVPVKLNGSRRVTGVLRGFDQFMNLVLEDCVEEVSEKERHNLGMVVRVFFNFIVVFFPTISPSLIILLVSSIARSCAAILW